ncbi:MAG: thioredoxin-like domain-containing protein [Bacteroidia bacterium]|nr:thioredoxin-like domain-containing protein [Bacteroidia bacterium]
MKKIIFFTAIIALVATMAACTQNKKADSYTINGEFAKGINAESVTLYNNTYEVINSAPVKDGKFVLTGKLDEPRKLVIASEEVYYSFDILLENDTYDLRVDERGITYLKGGKIHQNVLGYQQNDDYIKEKVESAQKIDELFANMDMENEEQLTKAREEMSKYEIGIHAYNKRENERVLEGDYTPLEKIFALFSIYDPEKYPVEKVLEMLNKYEAEIGPHPDLVFLRNSIIEGEKMIEMQQTVDNGAPFKEIAGKDRNGKAISLTDIVAANEYTILEFWASWCGPCRAEIPNLKKAYEKYKSKGLEILSVSLDAEHDMWTAAMDEEKPTWLNIIVENEFKNPQVTAYGIMGVPASFLINKEGTIVANNDELREFELDRTLDRIINIKK